MVTLIEDIIQNYNFLKKTFVVDKVQMDEVEEKYKDVFELISDVPVEFEELIKKSNLKVSDLMSKLTMLELENKIKRLSGNRFIRR